MNTTPIRSALSSSCRSSLAVLFAVLALLGLAGRVSAQGTVPERLSFQGYMEDGSGVPLGQAAPVNFEVTFRIFPTATGGSSVWTEKQTVTFDKGNYSVLLGQGTEVPPELYPTLSTVVVNANGSELYVETTVTINGNPAKILPRLRLLPTPYAFLTKKALVADQALSVNGSAIAVGSIPDNRLSANIVSGPIADNRLSANVTGPIPDNRLSANVALRGAVNTFTANQTFNANVGVGTAQPAARLSVVAPGATEIVGSAASSTLRVSAGTLGNTAGNELALASIGYNDGNASSLGIRSLRAANGSDWTSTAIGLGMDVDNTVRASGASVWLHGNGNVGISTTTPGAKLDVNGAVRSTGLTVNGGVTVNGTVSATTFSGTFNGEKPPLTITIGAGGNLNSWRDALVDATALFNDTDGGRIKVLMRNHGDQSVRIWVWDFFAETDAENFGRAGGARWGVASFNNGGENYFILGTTARFDIAAIANWIWIRNYRSGQAIGGVDGPAFTAPSDRYKFYALVPPNMTATIILYDR